MPDKRLRDVFYTIYRSFRHFLQWPETDPNHSLISRAASKFSRVGMWDKDVYLLSFPKCGRTWLRLMIGKTFRDYFQLRWENLLKLKRLTERHPRMPKIVVSHDDDPQWKLPENIERDKRKYWDKDVMFLVRDPRDVLVSLYFQKTKRKNRFSGSMSEFLRKESGSLKSLVTFYNIWAENREVPRRFLLVRYEALQADTRGELHRVMDFLGFDYLDSDLLQESVEFAEFDRMRKMEKKGRFSTGKLQPGDKEDPESYKTRRGVVGGYLDYLSAEDIRYVDDYLEDHLLDLYEEYV